MGVRGCILFFVTTLAFGCSAVVSPDESRLDREGGGGATDSGPGGRDAGTSPGTDAGSTDAGGLDSGAPPIDAGPGPCEGGPRCEDGVLVFCEGDEVRTRDCPLGCSGDRCARLVPSNVEPGLWSEGAPDVSLAGSSTYLFDTSDCTSVMAITEVVSQEDGPELCVLQVGDLHVGAGATLVVRGRRPLVVMATGEVVIDGTVDVSARGIEPGAGGFRGGWRDEVDGDGPGGGGGGEHVGSFDDGGGGGGALCGDGAAGGQGGDASGGAAGGAVSGGWELEPLFGGSGGGRGRGRFASGSLTATNAGLGGAGGGALQISALGSIRIAASGAVLAGGGGGLGGGNRVGDSNWGSGGGAGSGGAVLLEAPSVEVDGHVSVAGGGGGGGAGGAGDGGDGQNGREAIEGRASGGPAGDTFRGAPGGEGGGGSGPDALPGGDNTSDNSNGGGGGGGGGCILVRTADATVGGTPGINPSVAPSWRTLRVHTD